MAARFHHALFARDFAARIGCALSCDFILHKCSEGSANGFGAAKFSKGDV
ncbi:hypothetical protein BAG01nite_25950 [Brevibacillus agri]|uniref:Uncharacterized protein n=1 Tax=Brevibacillus agri TaxID=51101 RepID=A0ABQ0SRM7_9BACL|nr:hypothetical protein BAG01nite_25950 [Brevibacillus agri]